MTQRRANRYKRDKAILQRKLCLFQDIQLAELSRTVIDLPQASYPRGFGLNYMALKAREQNLSAL